MLLSSAENACADDKVFPEQFYQRSRTRSPEVMFYLAMIETAVFELKRGIQYDINRHWFEDPASGVVSLRMSCDAVGLDTSYIRNAVLRRFPPGAGISFRRQYEARVRVERKRPAATKG